MHLRLTAFIAIQFEMVAPTYVIVTQSLNQQFLSVSDKHQNVNDEPTVFTFDDFYLIIMMSMDI